MLKYGKMKNEMKARSVSTHCGIRRFHNTLFVLNNVVFCKSTVFTLISSFYNHSSSLFVIPSECTNLTNFQDYHIDEHLPSNINSSYHPI